jgi:hypothetical protein
MRLLDPSAANIDQHGGADGSEVSARLVDAEFGGNGRRPVARLR